ncbi:GNAT family N-acetyltransferase [Devosia sp. 1566]|uniref:GNAT family N-acetyltransferase n=1 Tax=Devosia sp. 1566 TaxID=2499144 RepID=UPI000FDA29CF|nr:GNAT family N-acetyltransferase [Devosia sp. 1566]
MDSPRQRLPATLTTTRLVLTTPALAHVPAIAELANNPRLLAVLTRLPNPYGESDAVFFVEELARSAEEWAWAIELEGRFIGTIGLHLLDGQPPALGYWLGEPFWGQGYGTEAARAVVQTAQQAGFTALRSRALVSNSASLAVLRKVGFVELGQAFEETGTLVGQPVVLLGQDLPQ